MRWEDKKEADEIFQVEKGRQSMETGTIFGHELADFDQGHERWSKFPFGLLELIEDTDH